jgi:probable DNA metabolism protein
VQLPQDFVATDFAAWRAAVRPLLAGGDVGGILRLPGPLMRLLETLACYRDAGRWELMYRLAWRTLHENRRLLEDHADRDVHRAVTMERALRRDVHKMHAYVRFREAAGTAGSEASFFVWFEPEHEILRRAAPFFVKRFPNMSWTIATPDGAAVWEDRALRYIDSPDRGARPGVDVQEVLWRTYYRSICNVARLNPAAMQREMPQSYWQHLPEAVEIRALLHEGRADFARRERETDLENVAMTKAVKDALRRLPQRSEGPAGCRRCDLWRHATQAVEGAGSQGAQIMLVGEQPGDEEDLKGEPFVGPAGRLLDTLIEAAGLERTELYVTNAVKHFKWEPRGKRRLHKRPDVAEIEACNVWLQRELARVKPQVVLALGRDRAARAHRTVAVHRIVARPDAAACERCRARRDLSSVRHPAGAGGAGRGAAVAARARSAARRETRAVTCGRNAPAHSRKKPASTGLCARISSRVSPCTSWGNTSHWSVART